MFISEAIELSTYVHEGFILLNMVLSTTNAE